MKKFTLSGLMILAINLIYAQGFTVSGGIYDDSDNPVPGVVVNINGTGMTVYSGTETTGADGLFTHVITDGAVAGPNQTWQMTIDSCGTSTVFTYDFMNNQGTTSAYSEDSIIMNCAPSASVSDLSLENSFEVLHAPMSNSLFVKTSELNNSTNLRVYNSLGVAVITDKIQEKVTQIDLEKLKTGIYFVVIESNGEKMTQKILK